MANLWGTIESYGIDPAPFFEAEGIKISLPINPAERVPASKLHNIAGAALKRIDDPYSGLRYGQNIHPSHLGALGYGWLASGSLHEGFDRLLRYVRIIDPHVSLKLEEESGDLRVTYVLDFDIDNPAIGADSQMATLVSMSRMIAGSEFNPKAVHFKHEEPADTGEYFAYFKCPLHFSANGNSLVIAAADLDRPLATGNPQLAMINDQVIIQQLAALDKNDIVNRVKAAIINALPSGNVSDDLIADQLHMAPRTMQRRLQDEELTFRAVLTEIRQKLAEQYIRDTNLTLTEVSYMLGFSESSSFSRAFKNWTGQSPSEARDASTSTGLII